MFERHSLAQQDKADNGSAPDDVRVPPAVDAVRLKVVEALNAGNGKALFDLLNAQMRQILPLDKATSFVVGVRDAKGQISVARATKAGQQSAVYILTAERGRWSLSIELDAAGQIASMLISEPRAPPPLTTNKIPIGLPFHGRWLVFWGGDTRELNHHIEHQSQRRAADLVIVGADGKTHRGEGKSNEEYLCFGQEILAVANGKVFAAIEGVPDNEPASLNPYFVPGNTVIIEHQPKLYSVYCHLKRGSVKVHVGQSVKKGNVLGLCGNSGHSSEPHLHFQLQDGPLFESSWGVEAAFENVSVTRGDMPQTIAKYSFRKGDLIDTKK
jgi:hypothetical protein